MLTSLEPHSHWVTLSVSQSKKSPVHSDAVEAFFSQLFFVPSFSSGHVFSTKLNIFYWVTFGMSSNRIDVASTFWLSTILALTIISRLSNNNNFIDNVNNVLVLNWLYSHCLGIDCCLFVTIVRFQLNRRFVRFGEGMSWRKTENNVKLNKWIVLLYNN